MDTLPLDSAARKQVPLWTFLSTYFPKTFVAMTQLSYAANEKHNPGQSMHWAREKSADHKDCILRHLLDEERVDPETGQPEAVAAAWRACANAELVIERLAAREKAETLPPLMVSASGVNFYNAADMPEGAASPTVAAEIRAGLFHAPARLRPAHGGYPDYPKYHGAEEDGA